MGNELVLDAPSLTVARDAGEVAKLDIDGQAACVAFGGVDGHRILDGGKRQGRERVECSPRQ
ncbi:MAG TPA: hypothetical protein VMK12_25055 [Anaeromyxobacteraceae bacterium]|nr:hypothetical protein [Anaeromyxobacteraceae bacterium]